MRRDHDCSDIKGVAVLNQVPADTYTAIISAWPFMRTVQVDVKAEVNVYFSMPLPAELAAALSMKAAGIQASSLSLGWGIRRGKTRHKSHKLYR